MKIVGVTGHRHLQHSKEELAPKVLSFLSDVQVSEVHTGMAQGWDLFITWLCYSNNINFIAHIPFEGQEKYFPEKWKRLYTYLRPKAKREIIYNTTYNKNIYFRRDEGIVDSTELMYAYYDGRNYGGTYYTIKYAYRQLKEVIYVL